MFSIKTRCISALLALIVISACGGSGGSIPGSTAPSPTPGNGGGTPANSALPAEVSVPAGGEVFVPGGTLTVLVKYATSYTGTEPLSVGVAVTWGDKYVIPGVQTSSEPAGEGMRKITFRADKLPCSGGVCTTETTGLRVFMGTTSQGMFSDNTYPYPLHWREMSQ